MCGGRTDSSEVATASSSPPGGPFMSRELLELILPRLAKRLNRQLRRYQSGRLDDKTFSQRFETLLQEQHAWLANKGYPEVDAAVAVHGAVLVLSGPGLRAEAE